MLPFPAAMGYTGSVADFDYQYIAGIMGAVIAQRKFAAQDYAQVQALRKPLAVSSAGTTMDEANVALDDFRKSVETSMSRDEPAVNVSPARMGFDLAMIDGKGIRDEWTCGSGMGVLVGYANEEMRAESPTFPRPVHRELTEMLDRICFITMPWDSAAVDVVVDAAVDELADTLEANERASSTMGGN